MNQRLLEKVLERFEEKGVKYSKVYYGDEEIIAEVSFSDDTDENKAMLVSLGFMPKDKRVFYVMSREIPQEGEAQIAFLQNETSRLDACDVHFRGYSNVNALKGRLSIIVTKKDDNDSNRRKLAEAGYIPDTKVFSYSVPSWFVQQQL